MADKLIITKEGIKEFNYTKEELEEIKKRQEEEKNKPKIEPQPTKEETLQDRIEALEKSNAELMNLIMMQATPTK